jgi:HTH-type transcriptional regulator / antitoxin HipB
MNEISSVVAAHRKLSGLSRAELADIAGVGKTVIFDIEHGKPSVRLDTLLKLLTALNITFELKSPRMDKLQNADSKQQPKPHASNSKRKKKK